MHSDITSAIDAFLASDDLRVLILKGDWGVGKTYFWNRYVEKKLSDRTIKQTAYVYLSLFGMGGLREVKTAIYESAANISRKLSLGSRVRTLVTRVLRKGARVAPQIPYGREVAEVIRAAEYAMVKDYLICFDDLERKSDDLTIRDLMGVVDELGIRKGCKIVLVFNDKCFEKLEDRTAFDRYREKVVDVEIEYAPSIEDNLALIFEERDVLYQPLLEAFTALRVRNIRVFKKVRGVLEAISSLAAHSQEGVVPEVARKEMAVYLAVLCWAYYCAGDSLPLEYVKEHLRSSSWMTSLLASKKEQLTDNDKRWNSIAAQLGLISCDYVDEMAELIETGFIPKDAFQKVVKSLNQKTLSNESSNALHKAWDLYGETFQDNTKEFLDAITEACTIGLAHLGLSEFSQAIDVLERFGRDVQGLITAFCERREKTLGDPRYRDSMFDREVHNARFREKIASLRKKVAQNLDIDTVASRIARDKGWNPEDIEFLASLTTDDLYKWMMDTPPDLVTKVKSGLLLFRRLTGSSAEEKVRYVKIAQNTVEALKRIGKQSPLNTMRVSRIYDIDLEA